LSSELCSFSLGSFHCSFKYFCGISKFEFKNRRKNVRICEKGFLLHLFDFIILDLSIDSGFRLIIDPFSNKKLVFIMIEIGSLAFSHISNPVTFEMITISLGEYSVAVPLALVPLTLVDVFISIDHSSLSLRHASYPVAVIAISIFVEEGASSVFLIFKPISSIFATKFSSFVSPVCTLTMTLISLPESFILIAILIEVNAETVLLIVLPVSDVSGSMLPLFSLDAAILLSLLFLDPVNGSVSAVLLSFIITHLP